MKRVFCIVLCVALLEICVAPYAATAQDEVLPDCVKTTQTLEAKVVACRAAAKSGDAKAQYALGIMYEDGWGVPQNYDKALAWYLRAAEQGFALAQLQVANMYYEGWTGQPNYAKALKWYVRAAAQGQAGAQAGLSRMYYTGNGLPKDFVLAYKWVIIAEAGGNEIAGRVRDSIAPELTPAQIAEAQRMAREWIEAHRAE